MASKERAVCSAIIDAPEMLQPALAASISRCRDQVEVGRDEQYGGQRADQGDQPGISDSGLLRAATV